MLPALQHVGQYFVLVQCKIQDYSVVAACDVVACMSVTLQDMMVKPQSTNAPRCLICIYIYMYNMIAMPQNVNI